MSEFDIRGSLKDGSPYHIAYGFTDEYRLKILSALRYMTVREVAEVYRVSSSSIYKWRKDYAEHVPDYEGPRFPRLRVVK